MSYDAQLTGGFDDAINTLTAALKEEGFGIISRIHMHTAFKEKIDDASAPQV